MSVDGDGPDEIGAQSSNQAQINFVQIVDGSQQAGTNYYKGYLESFDSSDESISTSPAPPHYILLEFPAGFVPVAGASYAVACRITTKISPCIGSFPAAARRA